MSTSQKRPKAKGTVQEAVVPKEQERTLEHLVFAAATEERKKEGEPEQPACIHLFYGTTRPQTEVENPILVTDTNDNPHRQFDVNLESATDGLRMVSVGWAGATRTMINQTDGRFSLASKQYFPFPDDDPNKKLNNKWRARLARIVNEETTHYFAATYHPDEGAEIPRSKKSKSNSKKNIPPGSLFYLSSTGFEKHPSLETSGLFLASAFDSMGKNYLYLTNQKRIVKINVSYTVQTWGGSPGQVFSKEPQSKANASPREKYISGSGIVHNNSWLGLFADNIGFAYLVDAEGLIGCSPRKNRSDASTIDLALATAAEAVLLLEYNGEVYALIGCNHGELRTYRINTIPDKPRETGMRNIPLTTDDLPVLNTGPLENILSPQSFHFAEDPFNYSRYYEKEGEKDPKPLNCCIKQIISWKQDDTLMVGYLYQKTFRALPFEQLLRNQNGSIRDSVWKTGEGGMQLYTFPAEVNAIDVLVLPSDKK